MRSSRAILVSAVLFGAVGLLGPMAEFSSGYQPDPSLERLIATLWPFRSESALIESAGVNLLAMMIVGAIAGLFAGSKHRLAALYLGIVTLRFLFELLLASIPHAGYHLDPASFAVAMGILLVPFWLIHHWAPMLSKLRQLDRRRENDGR